MKTILIIFLALTVLPVLFVLLGVALGGDPNSTDLLSNYVRWLLSIFF